MSIRPDPDAYAVGTRIFFASSSGYVIDGVLAEYIANQNENQDEDFRVNG